MSQQQTIVVPDIGDFKDVEVIEVLVKPGDQVAQNDSLITLESDKAAMEIPSPVAGTVADLRVAVGSRVSKGTPILLLEVGEEAKKEAAPAAAEPPPAPALPAAKPSPEELPEPRLQPEPVAAVPVAEEAGAIPHASPAVRRFARELGADLAKIQGSGPKGRILKEDVQAYIKAKLQRAEAPATLGFALPEAPQVDFSQFGPIDRLPLSRIQKLSAANLHRTWLTIPHVTQHDEADVTELEAFRESLKGEAGERGVKLTLLPFVIKAALASLKAFPRFNASLSADGESLILKQYYHIGFAVDTPEGLVVPVIRDADRKGIWDLAAELHALGEKARGRKLRTTDLQGGTFTISSLGGIGGTAFTPIINAPEVAILGISRVQIRPVYREGQFVPRRLLPLSLSYDHRVIDGAEGIRFLTHLNQSLQDLRRLLL
ncbi:MAG TPA: dihydrolipoyllysine-residue acetyltransferase [Methylococcus sp.]|nr:dihydrolipoyllysine-residue acetyltransferase [Methylococcus sp.]